MRLMGKERSDIARSYTCKSFIIICWLTCCTLSINGGGLVRAFSSFQFGDDYRDVPGVFERVGNEADPISGMDDYYDVVNNGPEPLRNDPPDIDVQRIPYDNIKYENRQRGMEWPSWGAMSYLAAPTENNQLTAEEKWNKVLEGFPTLDTHQRQIGVNPSYKAFYFPELFEESTYSRPSNVSKSHDVRTTGPTSLTSEKKSQPQQRREELPRSQALTGDDFSQGRDEFIDKMQTRAALASVYPNINWENSFTDDVFFTVFVAGCSAIMALGLVGAGFCYHQVRQRRRQATAQDPFDYPSYGLTGPGGTSGGGGARRLPPHVRPPSDRLKGLSPNNAHMFHYQQQRQQIMSYNNSDGRNRRSTVSKTSAGEERCSCKSGALCTHSFSDPDSECDDGDYTVYECPGLAPACEMEVRNPMFDDSTIGANGALTGSASSSPPPKDTK